MHGTKDGIRDAAIVIAISQMVAACTPSSVPDPARPPQPPARYVLEQETKDRWLYGAQRPEFTSFAQTTSPLFLTLALPDARTGERTIRASVRAPRSGDSLALTVRANGAIVRHEFWSSPPPPAMLPGDSARFARFRLRVGERMVLPRARVWDLVPQVRPRRFVAGARWTDTIALSTEYAGSTQALAGVRSSMLVRDTLVAGRRLWIVRDSALVRYSERELEYERTLDTLVAIDRTGTGTIRGQYVFDPDLRFIHQRADTTSFSGDAVLRYPDGRSFTTPVRYERRRHWTLYDTTAFAARQAARRAEMQRTYSGPVQSPSNETERRLASSDTALRDSLLSVWQRESNPNRRDSLYRLLTLWGSRGQVDREALAARRVAAGDSAFILRQLAERAYPARPPIEVAAARQMIRVMSDPGISFAAGGSRDAIYENLIQTLVTWPPAIDPDTSQWRCRPAACRLLGEQWQRAQEPRLRDVGLTMLVTLDPVRWADTAAARAAAGSKLILQAVQLANGVGAPWPAAAKLSLPAADADWRAWIAWSNAPAAGYRPPPGTPVAREQQTQMRFDESHATAIRFYQARTGRDVRAELRRHLAAATNDSARMVYGTLLTGLGDTPSVEQIAAQLLSGSAPQMTLARRSIHTVFGTQGPRADSATALAILDRLIASIVDGAEPWPQLTPARTPTRPLSAPSAPSQGDVMYVLADSVPRALLEKWRTRARFISLDEWRRMSERQPATLVALSSVERVGSFVRASTHVSGRLARQPNEVPRLWAAGTTYYLILTADGWRIVETGGWIT